MQHQKPPPRDSLSETWPEDHDGAPLTERQAAYFLDELERLRKKMPSEEDLAYLQRKREEDEHARYVVRMIKQHFPWLAIVGSAIASGVYYLLTHTITISNKQ